MSFCQRRGLVRALATALLLTVGLASTSHAYVLIADRPQNRIVKYSDSGTYLGVVVQDAANLGGVGNASGPNSLAVSSDFTKLFVTSLNGSLVRYDFNAATLVATNPLRVTSTLDQIINDPGGVFVHPTLGSIFVSNRGFGFADNIEQYDSNLTPVNAGWSGGGFTGRTGMALSPNGSLLAGTFGSDFMGGGPGGSVLSFDANGNPQVLVPASPALAGLGTLLVNGQDLYLTAAVGVDFQGRVAKFNALTGAPDMSFGTNGLVTPQISFPAGLMATSDGTGFLLSMLHFTDTGAGRVDRYLFDGTRVGVWAENSFADPSLGFAEATALLYVPVPEPTTVGGSAIILAALVMRRRRRTASLP